jgi:hypothetical protein
MKTRTNVKAGYAIYLDGVFLRDSNDPRWKQP